MSIKQLCFDAHPTSRPTRNHRPSHTPLQIARRAAGFQLPRRAEADAVIGQLQQPQEFNSDGLARLSRRSLAEDYPPAESQCIVEVVTTMAENHRLVAIDVRHLVRKLAGGSGSWVANNEEIPKDDAGNGYASYWHGKPVTAVSTEPFRSI